MKDIIYMQLNEVSGGKTLEDFQIQVVDGLAIAGAGAWAGPGGAAAAIVATYGVEGFIETVGPDVLAFLEARSKLSPEEIADRQANPYNYE